MKKTAIYCILLASVIIRMFTVPASASSANVQIGDLSGDSATNSVILANTCHGMDATSALLGADKIIKNAKSAFLYESGSDTLMYSLNADEKAYPASFVKIMTGYIAAEEGNLDDLVTVSEGAVSSLPVDAVSADLLAGEQIRLEDLLYCLLVSSANDAAAVIAEHISGSQEAFVELMNQYAKDIGCTSTQFTNAHGLHNEQQYTTARDSARILNTAIKNSIFREIFTSVKHSVPATNLSSERLLTSNNFILDTASKLYYDERVIGGRTGVTEDGRRSIATASEKNGMLLICIVMGSDTVYQEDGTSAITVGGYQETTQLLDAGFAGYKTAQIIYSEQALRQLEIPNGSNNLIIGPKDSVSAVIPETATFGELSFRYADAALQAPISKGEKVSSVQIWYGNMCVAQTDLFAMNDVAASGSVHSVEQVRDSGFTIGWIIWFFAGAVCVAGFGFGTFYLVKRFRILSATRRNRNYRRSRRRSR